MSIDQKPHMRDDLYLLNIVFPRWKYDAYEFIDRSVGSIFEPAAPAETRCRVEWTWEGLTMGLFIDLHVKRDSGERGNPGGYINLAAPFWIAPELDVPCDNTPLAAAWPSHDVNRLVPPVEDVRGRRDAPFEIFSRKVIFLPFGVCGRRMIRLEKRIAFDLGLRNAITHAAGKLRMKGVTW